MADDDDKKPDSQRRDRATSWRRDAQISDDCSPVALSSGLLLQQQLSFSWSEERTAQRTGSLRIWLLPPLCFGIRRLNASFSLTNLLNCCIMHLLWLLHRGKQKCSVDVYNGAILSFSDIRELLLIGAGNKMSFGLYVAFCPLLLGNDIWSLDILFMKVTRS